MTGRQGVLVHVLPLPSTGDDGWIYRSAEAQATLACLVDPTKGTILRQNCDVMIEMCRILPGFEQS